MKDLKQLTKEEYKKLDKAGMLYVLYPEATGDYVQDMVKTSLNDNYFKENPCKDCKNGPKPDDMCKTCKNYPLPKENKPTYKVGDWVYAHKDSKFLLRITDITCGNVYSFTGLTDNEYTWVINDPQNMRLATSSEIEALLKIQAKDRGFLVGAKFKSIVNENYIGKITYGTTSYDKEDDSFRMPCSLDGEQTWLTVYKQGWWSEIINYKTVKIGQGANEYEVKFKSNGIDVGCKHISRGDVEKLKSFYLLVHTLGFSKVIVDTSYEKMIFIGKGFEPIHVTLDEIQSIIEKIHEQSL